MHERDKLDVLATQGIHGEFCLPVRAHYDEAATTRCIIYSCQNNRMANVPVSGEYLHKLGSSLSISIILNELTRAYLVRSNGIPRTYKLRRLSPCLSSLGWRWGSPLSEPDTVLKDITHIAQYGYYLRRITALQGEVYSQCDSVHCISGHAQRFSGEKRWSMRLAIR